MYIYSLGREKGFAVKCFLRVPRAVGLHCSCRAPQVSKGNFQDKFYKTFFHNLMPQTVVIVSIER